MLVFWLFGANLLTKNESFEILVKLSIIQGRWTIEYFQLIN